MISTYYTGARDEVILIVYNVHGVSGVLPLNTREWGLDSRSAAYSSCKFKVERFNSMPECLSFSTQCLG